jgi:hypothetical protein
MMPSLYDPAWNEAQKAEFLRYWTSLSTRHPLPDPCLNTTRWKSLVTAPPDANRDCNSSGAYPWCRRVVIQRHHIPGCEKTV